MPKSYASVRNYEMDHKQFFERNEKFKLTFSWWISASVSGASPIKIMKLSHHDLNLKNANLYLTVFKIWCWYETDIHKCVHPEMPQILFQLFLKFEFPFTHKKLHEQISWQSTDACRLGLRMFEHILDL